MGAICSKKQNHSIPAEFTQQVEQLDVIRDWTLQVVQQLEKMNPEVQPTPSATDEKKSKKNNKDKKDPPIRVNVLDQLALTSVKFNTFFAGHPYAEQLGRFGIACKKLSRHSIYTQGQIEEKVINPMRQWALEGHANLMKELTKCQKIRDDLKRAQKESAAKPDDKLKKDKVERVKKAYETQLAYCTAELEAIPKILHTQQEYIRLLVELQWTDSAHAVHQLDGALMKEALVTAHSLTKEG